MISFYFGRRALYIIMNCKPPGNTLLDTSLRATGLILVREGLKCCTVVVNRISTYSLDNNAPNLGCSL